jgi:hypothetical protein
MSAMTKQDISRDDLEGKFRELQGEVETTTTSAKEYVIVAGAIALVAVASVAFVMGRRRGKRKSTVVEVRRL